LHKNVQKKLKKQHSGEIMDKPNLFNDLQSKLNQVLENSPAKDIEKNVKAFMTQSFSRLDLVTREEFDIQAQVLAKTRAKLEALEARCCTGGTTEGRIIRMSLAVLKTRSLNGMEAPAVTVEVHLANGLPAFTIVGLPETEVKEARDRVRAAIQNARFEFPARRITVNLAPADLPKESGRFDLPIALGILAASGQIPAGDLAAYEFAGELSLSGELRPVRGALAMTYAISRQPSDHLPAFILPAASAPEAALVRDAVILPAASLLDVCAHLAATQPEHKLTPYRAEPAAAVALYPDFRDVKGQSSVKRALEIAAAGNHSVLMSGPPGTGKSMLAARFPGILPDMTDQEALEAASVHSLTGGFHAGLWRQRPYRSPHHTVLRSHWSAAAARHVRRNLSGASGCVVFR
jgi:magnesium chelatase family protein